MFWRRRPQAEPRDVIICTGKYQGCKEWLSIHGVRTHFLDRAKLLTAAEARDHCLENIGHVAVQIHTAKAKSREVVPEYEVL